MDGRRASAWDSFGSLAAARNVPIIRHVVGFPRAEIGASYRPVGRKRAPLVGSPCFALPFRPLAVGSVQPRARHIDRTTRKRLRRGRQAVNYTPGPFGRGGASGVYKVTQLLPPEGGDYQYRIKSADELHERVVKESQLNRVA